MKQRHISMTIPIDEEFIPGDCYGCPFGYDVDFYSEEDGCETERFCVLGWPYFKCQLEIKEDD